MSVKGKPRPKAGKLSKRKAEDKHFKASIFRLQGDIISRPRSRKKILRISKNTSSRIFPAVKIWHCVTSALKQLQLALLLKKITAIPQPYFYQVLYQQCGVNRCVNVQHNVVSAKRQTGFNTVGQRECEDAINQANQTRTATCRKGPLPTPS